MEPEFRLNIAGKIGWNDFIRSNNSKKYQTSDSVVTSEDKKNLPLVQQIKLTKKFKTACITHIRTNEILVLIVLHVNNTHHRDNKPHTLYSTVPDSPQMERSFCQFIDNNFLQFAHSNNIDICHMFHDKSALSQILKVRRKFELHSRLKQRVAAYPFFTSTILVYCISLEQIFIKLIIFLYVMYLIFCLPHQENPLDVEK
jgi:hypothetical protein